MISWLVFALQMVLECLKCLGPINFYDNQKVFTTSTSFLWAVRLHTGDLQLKAGISISTLELEYSQFRRPGKERFFLTN